MKSAPAGSGVTSAGVTRPAIERNSEQRLVRCSRTSSITPGVFAAGYEALGRTGTECGHRYHLESMTDWVHRAIC